MLRSAEEKDIWGRGCCVAVDKVAVVVMSVYRSTLSLIAPSLAAGAEEFLQAAAATVGSYSCSYLELPGPGVQCTVATRTLAPAFIPGIRILIKNVISHLEAVLPLSISDLSSKLWLGLPS